jgi:hypothetical protein
MRPASCLQINPPREFKVDTFDGGPTVLTHTATDKKPTIPAKAFPTRPLEVVASSRK